MRLDALPSDAVVDLECGYSQTASRRKRWRLAHGHTEKPLSAFPPKLVGRSVRERAHLGDLVLQMLHSRLATNEFFRGRAA